MTGLTKFWNGTQEIAYKNDIPAQYVHPSSKQCNAADAVHTHTKSQITDFPDITQRVITQNTDDVPTSIEKGSFSIGPSISYIKFNSDSLIPNVGDRIPSDYFGFPLLVCHNDTVNRCIYVITPIITNDVFGNNTTYSTSSIYSFAQMLEAMTADDMPEFYSYLIDVRVNGTTSKIFIPSYEQMNGGFSWFNSNTRRKLENVEGGYASYWTSSKYSSTYVYSISNTGSIIHTLAPTTENGVAMCMCLSYSFFDTPIRPLVTLARFDPSDGILYLE